MQLYVERFNRRDWDGLRDLIRADARLMVADAFAGKLVDAPYVSNYEKSLLVWKLAVGEVDGEPVGRYAATGRGHLDSIFNGPLKRRPNASTVSWTTRTVLG